MKPRIACRQMFGRLTASRNIRLRQPWSRSRRGTLDSGGAALIGDLGSEDLKVRTAASTALLGKGFLARSALDRAYYESDSGNVKARVKAIQKRLRLLGGLPWEAMSNNLQLLSGMLSYAEPQVVEAVSQRLQKIVPQLKGLSTDEYATWITKHRANLKWNADTDQYSE